MLSQFVIKLCALGTSALHSEWSFIQIIAEYLSTCGPGNSVGIATDYRLAYPGPNRGGDEIFRPFRRALGPTQPPAKRVPALFRG